MGLNYIFKTYHSLAHHSSLDSLAQSYISPQELDTTELKSQQLDKNMKHKILFFFLLSCEITLADQGCMRWSKIRPMITMDCKK